jgi:transposase-like protein
MTKRDYTQEFKEQILRECQEVGNVAVVARRHNNITEYHPYLEK